MAHPKKMLITAGATREYWDPVRYLSNESSGKMGFAIATEAAKRGHEVILISGAASPETPKHVQRVNVISAVEMLKVVKKYYQGCGMIICSAAVADYRPIKRQKEKIKKELRKTIQLELVQNPDILGWLGSHKKNNQLLVGFALETTQILKNATEKLIRKKCDIMVANSADTLNNEKCELTLLSHTQPIHHLPMASKILNAKRLIDYLLKL